MGQKAKHKLKQCDQEQQVKKELLQMNQKKKTKYKEQDM